MEFHGGKEQGMKTCCHLKTMVFQADLVEALTADSVRVRLDTYYNKLELYNDCEYDTTMMSEYPRDYLLRVDATTKTHETLRRYYKKHVFFLIYSSTEMIHSLHDAFAPDEMISVHYDLLKICDVRTAVLTFSDKMGRDKCRFRGELERFPEGNF